MSCQNYDFNVTQDSTFNVRATALNSDLTYINLSGFTVTGYVKYQFASTGSPLFNLNPTIDPSYVSGLLLISGNVGQIPVGEYPYSISIYQGNYSLNVLNGYFSICPNVL